MSYKRKKAAALKYDTGYEAPIVTAAGVGALADKIIEKADENKVPIVYNKELADLLLNVDIGSSIPEELYEVVAEVINYVIDIDDNINKESNKK
ncbi:flagellar protein FhlB [Clostridium pasteurianum DSM 525 = ATCC 6013]|uniref:Flagellar protein FhlB n=1 Tax=Clostridium pasteurianum DSM 525 = ATCC 6013 TaxID=1262449 RepID=A0A0H3J8I5_CLOPA|nr:EscU/YscU/HrcU family type III secretion system export apparatus switch protein [Clostridium pasteurianum]AJA47380.1 flagellar protein FhlB [Clostridium pasteurianum DSM 525 = ATCC 6013]AJA51368.1 flagellar protein FhlB [Clostridium pasteurianum DSM 525 = ATCC 6013]AOZ74710.1 flagellar biogenesis protein [Clostridium pasteurianum DSM 525 = ATCC 6013]AOZ78506.1 flagellar biogenesis protein [Clostridium pasteurianum]ELP58716.1 Flagellar biosynthesis related protein [Clostridium pasteurianum D